MKCIFTEKNTCYMGLVHIQYYTKNLLKLKWVRLKENMQNCRKEYGNEMKQYFMCSDLCRNWKGEWKEDHKYLFIDRCALKAPEYRLENNCVKGESKAQFGNLSISRTTSPCLQFHSFRKKSHAKISMNYITESFHIKRGNQTTYVYLILLHFTIKMIIRLKLPNTNSLKKLNNNLDKIGRRTFFFLNKFTLIFISRNAEDILR